MKVLFTIVIFLILILIVRVISPNLAGVSGDIVLAVSLVISWIVATIILNQWILKK